MLNNNPGVKSWVNTLSHHFKVSTSVALGLLNDESYSFNDAQARRTPAQYVGAIMRHGIGCNIVDIANQLSFAYRRLAPELRVFISPLTELTKAANFIRAFEEKQEVWHEMMTTPATPQRYYKLVRTLSPFRPPLSTQSEVFSCFQTQQRFPPSQQSWRAPDRASDLTQPTPVGGLQRQYFAPLFWQAFVPQRQTYPDDRRQQRMLSPVGAGHNNAPQRAPVTQSTTYDTRAAANLPNYNPPRQPTNNYQAVPRQPYQSGQSQRVYQHAEEKGVYQVDNESSTEIDEDFPESKTYYTNEHYDELQVNFVEMKSMYDRCFTSFQSHSALHWHIKSGCNAFVRRAVEETSSDPPSSRPILRFAAKLSASGSGLAFRGWSYATTSITIDPAILPAISNPDTLVCLDTGSGVSLVNKAWLAKKYPSQKINTMPVPLKVRGIGASRHESGEFALTAFYTPGLDREGSEVYACVQCELHLVNSLKANMLIGNNVLCTEGFTINLANASAHILSCGITIVISAKNHSQFLKHNVLANTTTFISPKSEALINVRQIPLPDSRDFLFQPFLQEHLTLYSHLLDHTSLRIFVQNNADRSIQTPRIHRVGYITEIPFENGFATSVDHDAASTPPTSPFLFHERNGILFYQLMQAWRQSFRTALRYMATVRPLKRLHV